MDKVTKLAIAALRITLGWFMFYAGITKVLDPAWSAAGYLNSAKTFTGLFQWFASPEILPAINFINEWGLTLLGVSLILGVFVRLSSVLGAVLMMLYYFPVLEFPYVGHGFLIDDHIIYALVLAYFAAAKVGRIWGLENWCGSLPICKKFPKLRSLIG
ncbi:MAG: DoxX protein [Parcubacteria group bacterium Gr01-1014_3]|nr:MAG: DoxX protein [Parcubacteria group bacterium Gr01-1014_3]